jgi:hypothetical protein
MTQLKTKDLIERQDIFEVMIEALMRKMNKLSTDMINRYYFLVVREKRLKGILDKHFLLQMKL